MVSSSSTAGGWTLAKPQYRRDFSGHIILFLLLADVALLQVQTRTSRIRGKDKGGCEVSAGRSAFREICGLGRRAIKWFRFEVPRSQWGIPSFLRSVELLPGSTAIGRFQRRSRRWPDPSCWAARSRGTTSAGRTKRGGWRRLLSAGWRLYRPPFPAVQSTLSQERERKRERQRENSGQNYSDVPYCSNVNKLPGPCLCWMNVEIRKSISQFTGGTQILDTARTPLKKRKFWSIWNSSTIYFTVTVVTKHFDFVYHIWGNKELLPRLFYC